VQLDLAALSARLQAAGLAQHLRQALELLDGPITPLAAERTSAALAWAALGADGPHGVVQPALRLLLADARGLGLLKRLAAGHAQRALALCQHAARVLEQLPAQGQTRAHLAARCLGDAHALDAGQPVATLVLAALRMTMADDGEEGTRALWAAQGVSVNELARPALTLNLPLNSPLGQAPFSALNGPPAAMTAATTAALSAAPSADGEPRYWSLRQLLRQPPLWQVAGRTVYVCENPNLLAMAADALGPRCAPLLCTDGMPAAAQRALLGQLATAGARLRYHGDFDWAGIHIAHRVLHDFGAQPWRFSAPDYKAALHQTGADAQAPLRGSAVVASWCSGLTAAMQQGQCAIAEEALLSSLLPDLAGTD